MESILRKQYKDNEVLDSCHTSTISLRSVGDGCNLLLLIRSVGNQLAFL